MFSYSTCLLLEKSYNLYQFHKFCTRTTFMFLIYASPSIHHHPSIQRYCFDRLSPPSSTTTTSFTPLILPWYPCRSVLIVCDPPALSLYMSTLYWSCILTTATYHLLCVFVCFAYKLRYHASPFISHRISICCKDISLQIICNVCLTVC